VLAQFMGTLGLRLAMWQSDRYSAYGVTILLPFRSSSVREQVLKNVVAALAYIARYNAGRSERLRRDLRGILVGLTPPGSRAYYADDLRLCVLNGDVARHGHPGLLAAAIAHEATHARLRCFPYDTAAQRFRVERLCKRAEIDLVSRIPGGDRFVGLLRQELASLTESMFTDDAINKRRQARTTADADC